MAEDELSEPFFKGIGVAFVEVESNSEICDLCPFFHKHPPPPAPSEAIAATDNRWGVPFDVLQPLCLCKVENEEEQHAFHLRCLRAFVAAQRGRFRNQPKCPMCAGWVGSDGEATAAEVKEGEKKLDGDEVAVEDEEVGALGGKKRKRDKQMYSLWVHVIQATGLKLVKSDKYVNPIAVISAFGKERKTKRGDNGKTYSCVWDEAFSFQKLLDEDQLTKETINIRIEHDKSVWVNELIGQIKLNAETVHNAKDHEFYRQWTPILHVGGKKDNGAIGTQGKFQLSICVLSEKDIQNDPRLPIHIYDLEVQMWSELQQKQAVNDFDFNSNYLQNKLEQKKDIDANLISDLWDILRIRIYKAEDLPKVDKSGWCDGYIELDYKGLLDKSKKLRSKTINKTKDPIWNHEFELPLPADQPLFYDRFHLILRDENKFQQDVEIGRCRVNIADVLALTESGNEKKPMWKTLYLDKDGEAPLYRGRILVEFSIERGVKSARMGSNSCPNVTDSSLPITCSYQLDCEIFEGIHLPGDYSDYQVDVSWGHAMLGGDSDKERDKAGRCWMTFESTKDKVSSKKMVPFLTKKTALVHNFPRVDELSRRGITKAAVDFEEKEKNEENSSDTGKQENKTEGEWKSALTTHGFSGDGETVPTSSSVPINFNTNTLPLHSLQQLPDIIVYVSKKGSRDKCVGYLRIPVEGRKRPTENWEHGEDLTIFPALCGKEGEKEENTARCFALKPLVEMYEQLCGFLLIRLQVRPVTPSAETIKISNQLVTTKLAPVPRQRYRFAVSVFQAKELASVDPSGLSSPFLSVELMDVQLRSKHRPSTTFPLWFETLEGVVELPVNLLYAPDITATVYHYKAKSVFKFRDPSIFMGKAEITAVTAEATKPSAPAWYPLQFEEHQYGAILLAFQLTAEKDVNLLPASTTKKGTLETMIDGWDVYAVDVSALAMRGPLALKFEKKKVDPVYELECWNDVQSFSQSQALKNSLTVIIRKPSNPVYYSSLNVRVYEGKELVGVTSLSVDKILRTATGWYRLVDVLMRTEDRLSAKYARCWRRFVAKKKLRRLQEQVKKLIAEGKDPAAELGVSKEVIAAARRSDNANAITPAGAATGENGISSPSLASSSITSLTPPEEKKKSRFDYLRQVDSTASPLLVAQSASYGTSASVESLPLKRVPSPNKDDAELLSERKVRSDSDEDVLNRAGAKADAKADDVVIEIHDANVDPSKAKIAATKMLQPRNVDENGNEKIDEKQLIRLQCDEVAEKDAESPWDRHWNIQCEYELLPLTKDPFLSADVFTGKDEIHQTFLEKLFARSKHSVGTLRGNFYAYPYKKRDNSAPDSAASAARNNFDLERYATPSQYCVRVYVLRCLQLITSKGKAGDCDPFVQFQLGEGGEPQKTDVVDASLNPKFYKCFDFPKHQLPAVDSSLTINVFNDSSAFGPSLIGSTVISLENRLFSRQWYNGRRMTERRPIFASKRGRLPQGFVEICLDIVPQHEAGARPLDYLLNPPKREPWAFRAILWNTKNVTPKKIYKHDDDCCCYDLCAPPNQSDIKLVCGFSGSKLKPQMTDIHYRSIDGEGNFNWRTLHTIELPAPEPLTYFKVQVWNINWDPNDCIAEAVMPLWGWLEFCRRSYDKNRDSKEKWTYKLPKQWVRMTHPQNTDKGDVEIELELLPADIAAKDEYKAAAGEEGWDAKLNAPDHIIPHVKRPESSFPWYRIDKQIIWRIKYCWKKSRWILLLTLILAIAIIVGLALLKKYVFD